MTAQLITLPYRPVINVQGGFESGALLDVFLTGTTTRVSVYTDAALTQETTNPVVANAVGSFPPLYYDDANVIRVRPRNADGSLIENADVDPYLPGFASAEAAADAAAISATEANASAIAAALSETNAGTSATAAATSASSAANAPGTSATSTTTLTIGTGSKSFTLAETGKEFALGQLVTIASSANADHQMYGNITAFNSGTGAMTVNVRSVLGSGPRASWVIALSGGQGADGAGTGTVTSVSGTGTVNGLTLTGTVTASGNLTLGGSLANVSLTTQVTGTLPVANGGTGSTTAANARTALGAAASGANTDITALDQDVTITATGTIAANSIGFRGLPAAAQAQGSTITFTLANAGQLVPNTLGGWAIPANGATAFPVGTTIILDNDSGSTQTVTITTDTLRLAGTSSTGTRTVAARGLATLVKVKTTEWKISGNVS